MNSKLTLAAASAALALVVPPTTASASTILYVANSNSAAFQAFAEGEGHTWTFKASGTGATAESIGGDLDQSITIGGATQTRKAYMESFDLVIVSTPITSGNYVDGALGADWAGINAPILFTASFAARATGGRVGLISGADLTGAAGMTYVTPNETTINSASAISGAIFAGATTPQNLVTAATGQTVGGVNLATINIGGGELISYYTASTNNVAAGIVYWKEGTTDSIGRSLANNRSLFALNGSFADLSADGQIVMGNLIEQTISPIPEPSSFAALAGLGALGLCTLRRRRA